MPGSDQLYDAPVVPPGTSSEETGQLAHIPRRGQRQFPETVLVASRARSPLRPSVRPPRWFGIVSLSLSPAFLRIPGVNLLG